MLSDYFVVALDHQKTVCKNNRNQTLFQWQKIATCGKNGFWVFFFCHMWQINFFKVAVGWDFFSKLCSRNGKNVISGSQSFENHLSCSLQCVQMVIFNPRTDNTHGLCMHIMDYESFWSIFMYFLFLPQLLKNLLKMWQKIATCGKNFLPHVAKMKSLK